MELENRSWWSYLDQNQRDFLTQAHILLEREEHMGEGVFTDYAFIVFPAAKAYEGFLKKLFLGLGFISQADFEGDHFRIGRSLNPSLPPKFRENDWLYEKLAFYYGSDATPQILWNTWKESRNLLFHWFPGRKNAITLPEAKEKLEMVLAALDAAFMPKDSVFV